MCGIFALLNYNEITPIIKSSFDKGAPRGPENSTLTQYGNNIMGFHRLAINGLNDYSNQPFNIGGIILICNGEIYNFRELAKQNNITMTTDSDCEIIIHMYRLYGFEYTLNCLDGVFAFVLYDTNEKMIHIARDPYGVRPLYYFMNWDNTYGFASEQKCLYDLCKYKHLLFQFLPGQYASVDCTDPFIYLKDNGRYTAFPCNEIDYYPNGISDDIVYYIHDAVRKRVEGTTARPIACLLSGGLDSSLICALVNQYYDNPEHRLETYSIGLEGSEDLKYAKIVADYLETDHHEIVISEEDFFNAIPEVIHVIESYDTTTIRASVGNYLIGKYIAKNSKAKVIFNGDGADELMGGYLYLHKAPSATEFDRECKRLLNDIPFFDVLRSDKSISSNGLEPRTPFLDRKWVEFYLSISKDIRYHVGDGQCEKFLIRNAFYEVQPDLLPEEILWRTKEAFSDGVSSLTRSWFTIIQENIERLCDENPELLKTLDHNLIIHKNLNLMNPPTTVEQSYYRYLYNKSYYGTDNIIPYFWMPKYVDAKDASARTLKIYDEINKGTNAESNDNANTIQSPDDRVRVNLNILSDTMVELNITPNL